MKWADRDRDRTIIDFAILATIIIFTFYSACDSIQHL